MYAGVPPDAARLALYAVPTIALGNDVVVMAKGVAGVETVMETEDSNQRLRPSRARTVIPCPPACIDRLVLTEADLAS